MELVRINRLRGKTADFVESEVGIRTCFADIETESESDFVANMEMSIENWKLFADELNEAISVFEAQSASENDSGEDGNGNTEDGSGA